MKSKFFKPGSIRLFLLSMGLTFLMSTIPHLGIKIFTSNQPKIISQTINLKPEINLKPQLEAKQNYFQLKKNTALNPTQTSFDTASAYIAVDLDSGEVILAKNADQKLPIASLTKIMTAVVALDLAKPEEKFTVSQKASLQVPTKVMLKPNEQYRLKTLLDFMLISSANDGAEVIKEGIDSKFEEGTFIKAMNLKSKLIGLKNTHFTTAQGFDGKNHYSSAEDLAILTAYALKEYPEISEIVSNDYKDLTGGSDFRFYLNNWNGLLGVYPGTFGVKTGNTAQAEHTTIVASEREGEKVLAVVLGAPGVLERDLWTAELLDLSFERLADLTPIHISEAQLREKYASWKYF